MGSAEQSGVSGRGFGQALERLSQRLRLSSADTAKPALLAIAGLIGSVVILALDAEQAVSEAREKAALIATLAATQIDNAAGQPDALTQIAIPPALTDTAHFAVLDTEQDVVQSSQADMLSDGYIQARADLDELGGEVVVAISTREVLTDRLPRTIPGLLAMAGALLVLLHLWRVRRASAPAGELEALPYGLALWSDNGQLVRANGAFARLLHLDSAPIRPGASYTDITAKMPGTIAQRPVLDSGHQRVVEVALEGGRIVLMDERPCPSGGFLSVVTDITDRKSADRMLARIREEQKLLARRYHDEKVRAEASSRAKSNFLAHLSHDIRTPLNHIIGFADMIRLETFGPLGDSKYLTYLDDIKRSGEQLLGSFAEILDYAELEAGRKSLRRERLGVNDLLQGTAARFSLRARNARVRLRVEHRADGEVFGDRYYLDRMLANLLDNALRFSDAGGSIRIAAWVADGGVVLEVTDTGVGMSEEQMARLSQPFVLSDAAFARDHHGIGLGIATARAIAEQSGGRLAIDSLEGIGTTVAIFLPLAEQADVITPQIEPQAAA